MLMYCWLVDSYCDMLHVVSRVQGKELWYIYGNLSGTVPQGATGAMWLVSEYIQFICWLNVIRALFVLSWIVCYFWCHIFTVLSLWVPQLSDWLVKHILTNWKDYLHKDQVEKMCFLWFGIIAILISFDSVFIVCQRYNFSMWMCLKLQTIL